MEKQSNQSDLFSRFVNWFSEIDADKEEANQTGESQDLFSRFMNRISGS